MVKGQYVLLHSTFPPQWGVAPMQDADETHWEQFRVQHRAQELTRTSFTLSKKTLDIPLRAPHLVAV